MKIGQLSQRTGLSAYTIRYYEKVGLVKRPGLDSSGHRAYGEKDVDLINWVNCLKKSGMTLDNIKKFVRADSADNKAVLIYVLTKHLHKLQQQHHDITHYLDVTKRKLKKLHSA